MIPVFEIELAIKLLIAFIFGIVIGLDRERSGKVAGVRTQMLICVGSALLAGISIHLADKFAIPGMPRPDPARLMAQIVTGIGFVGAGVILKSNQRVTGVTTAATIWTTSAVGIAIGSGFYLSAIVTTLLVLSLEPLALLQYKYGLKTYTYVLKIPKIHEEETLQILDNLKLKYKINNSDASHFQLTVYASIEKEKELTSSLNRKHIHFNFFEVED